MTNPTNGTAEQIETLETQLVLTDDRAEKIDILHVLVEACKQWGDFEKALTHHEQLHAFKEMIQKKELEQRAEIHTQELQASVFERDLLKEELHYTIGKMKTAYEQAAIYAQELTDEIAERKQAQAERERLLELEREHNRRLRALGARLNEVAEEERKNLSHELHDQVGQNLSALGINLNIIKSLLPPAAPEKVFTRLADSLTLVASVTDRIRDVMAYLRPPVLDEYGLVAALHWYGQQVNRRTNIPVTIHGTEPNPRMEAVVENALFRISQEALNNISKYAQASQVTINLMLDDHIVRLIISDNGIGFEPDRRRGSDESPSWGLSTMVERAESVGGHCRVESAPGAGTQIIVEVGHLET